MPCRCWVSPLAHRATERKQAEERQKVKVAQKQAQAVASKKSAEEKARAREQQLQRLRSEVFAAARRGDSARVRKGVYEDNVDASSGEVRKGGDKFVEALPNDTRETLLHIAAKQGDADLLEWLESHGGSSCQPPIIGSCDHDRCRAG